MYDEDQNLKSPTDADQLGFISYEEAKAIIEKLDEDGQLQLEYNETRLAEDLTLLNEDMLPMHQNITEDERSRKKTSSKFYSKSLTLLLQILKLIENGRTQSEIGKNLNMHKSHVSYYIKKLKQLGYIKESLRDVFKIFEITQPGKNFIATCEKSSCNVSTCRAENIRFKADIISIGTIPMDWNKVQMNHWIKYSSEIKGVKVLFNLGNQPSVEFLPPPIDGDADDDHDTLGDDLLQDCIEVAQELEDRLDMKIGRLHRSSKGEWIVYSPVAKAISKRFGQITVRGVGKINASKPRRFGEFEFYNANDAAEYMDMPRRVRDMEQQIQKLKRDMHKNQIKRDTKEAEYTVSLQGT